MKLDLLMNFDIVVIQELVAPPFDGTYPDGENYSSDPESKAFFDAVNDRGFVFVFSGEDTGPVTYDNNENSQINETGYQYSNLRLHRQGKGFLGFEKTVFSNLTSLETTETTYDFDHTFYSVFASEVKHYKNQTLVSINNYTQSIHSYDNGQRFLPYTSATESEDLINGVISGMNLTLDSSGNLISKISNIMDDSRYVVHQTSSTYSNYNTFGLPGTLSTIRTRGTESITRNKIFTYNLNGSLLTETRNFGLAGSLTLTYTYDAFGNPLTVSESDGSITRSSSVIYEANKSRFIWKQTNPLGQETEYSFDHRTGNLLWSEDFSGLRTTNVYNDFGDLIQTILPTGQVITSSLSWSGGSENIEDVYYEKIESISSPTTFIYFDVLGREVRHKIEGFDGTYISSDNIYDSQGRIDKSYSPYFTLNQDSKYVNYSYDDLGRVATETSFPQNITKSYTYAPLKTTTTISNRNYIKETDETGLVKEITEPGGVISYTYNPEGQIASIVSPSGTTSIEYDSFGYQDKLNDLDANTIDYDYNIWGELISQTDANGNMVESGYDSFGRLIEKSWVGGETITYSYNSSSGLLDNVISDSGAKEYYYYDDFYRLLNKTEEIDPNNIYTLGYTYDSLGAVTSMGVNNDITIIYDYNSRGYNTTVDLVNSTGTTSIWAANSMNENGIVDDYYLGNGVRSILDYDIYGFLDRITSSKDTVTIQDWDYDYDPAFGNMTRRRGLNSLGTYNEEIFAYDLQNRLISYIVGQDSMTMTYDGNGIGNILTKEDAGTYNYGAINPHQVTAVTNPTSILQNLPTKDITYTEFNKIESIYLDGTGIDKNLDLFYGINHQRVKTIYKDYDATILTKYFALEMYEKEVTAGAETKELFYINTPSGLSAILESTSFGDSLYFVYSDILGSYDVITNDQGLVQGRMNFDPWGRRRSIDMWEYNNVSSSFIFNRGFTGHEHLDDFGLINMNGRVYDPLLAVFLSPDNFIQSPGNTQNLNRYTYCFNNPLVYTDPDGELAWFIPVIIGALTGFEAGGWISSGTPAPWKWESKDWKAAGVGAMIGAGGGALASTMVGAAGGITGLSGAGWNITSNALLSSNIGIGSNLLQGRGIDGAFKGGMIGLAAGGLGAWSTTAIKGSSFGANLFSDEINTIGQAVTGATYGFGDRFVRGHEMGYRGGKLWGTAFLGMLEGGLSGYYGGTWGGDMSFAGKSLITNSIASVPGLGFSIAKYYGYGLVGWGSVATGVVSAGGVTSLFANETIGAIAGSVAGITAGIGTFSLYDPLALKYVKNKFNYYPSVLTVDQIIDSFWRMLFNK